MSETPNTTNGTPDGGGAGALGLLNGPFGGAFPSITGGPAGPSYATQDTATNVTMNSAFSVAGQGGSSNATASPTKTGGATKQIMILSAAMIAGVILWKKL